MPSYYTPPPGGPPPRGPRYVHRHWWQKVTGRQWAVIVLILVALGGIGIWWKYFREDGAFVPFHPEATQSGRFLLAQARTHGATIPLTDRISLRRDADGTETVIVRNTSATEDDIAAVNNTVMIGDSTSDVGEVDLAALGLQGQIKSVGATAGTAYVAAVPSIPARDAVEAQDAVEGTPEVPYQPAVPEVPAVMSEDGTTVVTPAVPYQPEVPYQAAVPARRAVEARDAVQAKSGISEQVAVPASIVVTTWAAPVYTVKAIDGGIEVVFPSVMAQALGAGQEVEEAGTEDAEEDDVKSGIAAVDAEILAAVVSQEDVIVTSWQERGLKGDELKSRVETFEAYAAVRTSANPNFFDESTTATGLYAVTEPQLQALFDAPGVGITFKGSAHDLAMASRGHADVATKIAVAYWLVLEGQTFPESPSAAARFKAFKEAWCAVGLQIGVAAMRARIEADAAEDPTDDPLLVSMQSWYEALATYHASYPIKVE